MTTFQTFVEEYDDDGILFDSYVDTVSVITTEAELAEALSGSFQGTVN